MDELVSHARVDADQMSDDPRRNLLGVLDGTITFATLDEPIDQRMAEGFGVFPIAGDRPRSESGEPSALTVEGELNKLAANISIGRNWAGVHYFSDY